MPHGRRGHDGRQGEKPPVEVRQDRGEDRHPRDARAAALMLLLADTQREVHEGEGEDVRPDQEMDASDRRHQQGHDDGHDRGDPIADEPSGQSPVDRRQHERCQSHDRRPSGVIDHQGQQDVETPGLIDPGGVRASEGQGVASRHGARGHDVPAETQVPERSRIVEQGVSSANQDEHQHQREDEVARARNQAAPANQGVFPLVHASMSLAVSLRFIATIDCDFPYQA